MLEPIVIRHLDGMTISYRLVFPPSLKTKEKETEAGADTCLVPVTANRKVSTQSYRKTASTGCNGTVTVPERIVQLSTFYTIRTTQVHFCYRQFIIDRIQRLC